MTTDRLNRASERADIIAGMFPRTGRDAELRRLRDALRATAAREKSDISGLTRVVELIRDGK